MRLIFISGSSDVGSANWKLAPAAADVAKSCFDHVDPVVLDPTQIDLPSFEHGSLQDEPVDVTELKSLLASADGFFVSSDEYTGVYSSELRNMVGWLRLSDPNQQTPFRDAPVALCGTAGRGAGGLRGQPALQQFFRELGAFVISQPLDLGSFDGAFDPEGRLLPKVKKQLVDGCLRRLCEPNK
jgi:chromate reductase, NAD(P)H dehydrogenase (quinone)